MLRQGYDASPNALDPQVLQQQLQMTKKLSLLEPSRSFKDHHSRQKVPFDVLGFRIWSAASASSTPVAAAVPPGPPRQVWISTHTPVSSRIS